MRKSSFLPAVGAIAVCAASSFAQTPTQPPTQTPTQPPTYPAPIPAPAAPASLPAYGPQQTIPATMPTPAPVAGQVPAYMPYGIPDEDKIKDTDGSTYIPVDSWIYGAMTRLYSLGYADTMFLSMRPWTRKSVLHMLDESEDSIRDGNSEEAVRIYAAVRRELAADVTDGVTRRGTIYGTETSYTRLMGISGTSLRDSYHVGQTVVNDYGRPYQPGFNLLAGASTVAEYGRFSLYLRGEYQHAPSAPGYSLATAMSESAIDIIPFGGFNRNQATIPQGPIAAENPFRLVEATVSFHIAGHEISGGKSDAWLGPAQGGAMAWSNNAENIYSFRVNRVEPLHIPLVSRVLGPLRYDVFYGSLKGHTDPNSPWVHSAMFSFRPSVNFEFSFQRTVIFGGEGHEPVTLHTFLKSFFSIADTTEAEKFGRNDPGARFSDFSMSYRLPFLRKYATFYTDSIAHDDVTPPSAPRRAAYRPGIYISQFPGLPKLDFRVEAASTDPGVSRSTQGTFNYFETIHRQGYTNKGFIMGDWIGREAKGGQAWITYHLSANEMVQLEYLNKKTPKDFLPGAFDPNLGPSKPGGTTQNQFKANLVKRFDHEHVELNAWFQYEKWKAPIITGNTAAQSNTTTSVQLTYYPGLRRKN